MPNLDEKMSALAETVLKRSLSEEEQLEIYRISDAMGMANVQSFLYLLLVFKLHEDMLKGQYEKFVSLESRLNGKFEEIAVLEEKINGTLESSVARILGDGAERIGADMGDAISARAENILAAVGEYHSLRGQTIIVCFFWVASTLAYWLGSADVLSGVPSGGTLEVLMLLPAGWCVFFCGTLYTLLWACDHRSKIKKTTFYRTLLGLQIFFLSLLALMLL